MPVHNGLLGKFLNRIFNPRSRAAIFSQIFTHLPHHPHFISPRKNLIIVSPLLLYFPPLDQSLLYPRHPRPRPLSRLRFFRVPRIQKSITSGRDIVTELTGSSDRRFFRSAIDDSTTAFREIPVFSLRAPACVQHAHARARARARARTRARIADAAVRFLEPRWFSAVGVLSFRLVATAAFSSAPARPSRRAVDALRALVYTGCPFGRELEKISTIPLEDLFK